MRVPTVAPPVPPVLPPLPVEVVAVEPTPLPASPPPLPAPPTVVLPGEAPPEVLVALPPKPLVELSPAPPPEPPVVLPSEPPAADADSFVSPAAPALASMPPGVFLVVLAHAHDRIVSDKARYLLEPMTANRYAVL